MSKGKVALITGVTGQDGAYLAELLLPRATPSTESSAARRASTPGGSSISTRIRTCRTRSFILHYGDMTDATNLIRIVQETQPDEIYNLAAQSHVQVSFETAEYTANADAHRNAAPPRGDPHPRASSKKTRFYQASTSELYGKAQAVPQNETTPFYPRSPYAAAKLYAYWITVNYREAYGLHASNGILFNHESPMRGETFVTRKITRAVAAIHLGMQDRLYIGNLDAKRDWGHAREYVARHVDDPAAGRARRLRAGDRRNPQRARIRREGVSQESASIWSGGARASRSAGSTRRTAACSWKSIRAIFVQPRSIC